MRSPEADYVIRIVGDPDGEQYDEHETIPFDGKDQLENFSNVLEKRGIPHSTQAPIEGNGGTGR